MYTYFNTGHWFVMVYEVYLYKDRHFLYMASFKLTTQALPLKIAGIQTYIHIERTCQTSGPPTTYLWLIICV